MQSLLLKLQADVAARKRPQTDFWKPVRNGTAALILFTVAFQLGARSADSPSAWFARAQSGERIRSMHSQVEAHEGTIELQAAYIARLERIQRNSARYGIDAEMAALIEDIALAENVDPALAFKLVRAESGFNARAVSPVGAVGLTQVMPETARHLAPGIKRHQLFDRETNLRLGFRFLRSMHVRYGGNMELALLAYNRGPATIDRLLAERIDPANGYVQLVLGRKGAASR